MMRKLALLVLAAAFGAVAVSSPPPARAEAADPGFAFYEKAAKDILKGAGVKCWECSEDAYRSGFHEFAVQQAERAIEFDSDQADAREYLKYAKKAGKWVQDPAAYESMPKQNSRPSKDGKQESEESFQKRVKKWEEESLAKTNKYVAMKYAELGDVCAAKGFPDQAAKGYEASMRLDKDNEKARKGLGYMKFGKVWLTKKQDEARKSAQKCDKIEQKEPSEWEELFKTKLTKVETVHVHMESGFSYEETVEHCKAAETAYAYYLADFGKDPSENVFEDKVTFVVMNTDDQWNTFVDRFVTNDKEFTRGLSGTNLGETLRIIRGGQANKDVKKADGKMEHQIGSSPETRRDHIVHGMVHALNHQVWRLGEKAWLDEGLVYYYTLKTLETCLTHCVAKKTGDYANGHMDEGGLKKWDDPMNWKPMLKQWVQKKDDVPLRTLIMLPITKLEFLQTVKAWAFATWLMDLDRAKFIRVLDQMLDPAIKQENVLQGEYGKGLEDIDEDWHKFALKCF